MRFEVARRGAGAFVLLAFAIAALALGAVAQEKPSITAKESEYATKLQDKKTDIANKMKIGEKFVKEFPKSSIRWQVARYLAGQIAGVPDMTQRATYLDQYVRLYPLADEVDYAAPAYIELYSRSQNYEKEFEIATGYFSRKVGEGDLRTRLFVAVDAGTLAYSGNKTYVEPSTAIIVKAIEIIDSGVKPADVNDEDWKAAPTEWKSQFSRSLGFIQYATGKTDEAFASFETAVKLNPKDVNSWAMLGFVVDSRYQLLAKQAYVADGAKKEELTKKATGELDKVIEYFARVVAMTDGDQAQASLNQSLRGNLETYYKFRNGGSTKGLDDYIKKFKN